MKHYNAHMMQCYGRNKENPFRAVAKKFSGAAAWPACQVGVGVGGGCAAFAKGMQKL